MEVPTNQIPKGGDTMTDLLGHLGNALTISSALVDTLRKADNSVYIKEISEMNLQLAAAQNEAARLMKENQLLKDEVEEQKSNPLRYDGEVYRDKDGHAFCPGCYDGNRKRIHLKKTFWRFYVKASPVYLCPICDNKFPRQDG